MFSTQGREGGRGPSWLATTLAASGLVFGVATVRPATACHITHHKKTTTETTSSVAKTSDSMTPEQHLQAGLQKLLAAMPSQSPTTTPATTITPTSASMPQALPQVLTSVPPTVTSSVATWHQTPSNNLTPPTPSSNSDNSPYASSQSPSPPPLAEALLGTPGKLFAPPTPAPEPSTLAIALGLSGAFAWRLRRKSRRVDLEPFAA